MDKEKHLDSIQELDEQIGELERTIAQLKRTRNSLLNITTLIPPEILGKIFCWSRSTSYNFLFVCHHWFEVASNTPELWSSWGKTLRDWKRRHVRFRSGPLNLELQHTVHDQLDGSLMDAIRDTLRDRAARDTIRQISLESGDPNLLNSIISSITPDDVGLQSSQVESLAVRNQSGGQSTVDLSNFLLRYRLPALRHLWLSGRCRISTWGWLESQTTRLVTLSLKIEEPSSAPTISQLLSTLSSNPNLQEVELSRGLVPDCGVSTSQVSLPSLKRIRLKGYHRNIFGLLNLLEVPDKMDEVRFFLDDCPMSDLSQSLGRYLGVLVRRRGRFHEGLGLRVHPGATRFHVFAGDVIKLHGSARVNWFVVVGATVRGGRPQGEELGQLCSALIEQLPLNEIVYLRTTAPVLTLEGACIGMANLAKFHLDGSSVPTWFADPHPGELRAHEDPFPSLKHLTVSRYVLNPEDWDPFTAFLARRASIGRRIISLVMGSRLDVAHQETIRGLVEDLTIGDPAAL